VDCGSAYCLLSTYCLRSWEIHTIPLPYPYLMIKAWCKERRHRCSPP